MIHNLYPVVLILCCFVYHKLESLWYGVNLSCVPNKELSISRFSILFAAAAAIAANWCGSFQAVDVPEYFEWNDCLKMCNLIETYILLHLKAIMQTNTCI